MQEHNSRLISVDDRAVESGDTTTIDFEGSVDGVPFEGGKAENYDLEIGKQYIYSRIRRSNNWYENRRRKKM